MTGADEGAENMRTPFLDVETACWQRANLGLFAAEMIIISCNPIFHKNLKKNSCRVCFSHPFLRHGNQVVEPKVCQAHPTGITATRSALDNRARSRRLPARRGPRWWSRVLR